MTNRTYPEYSSHYPLLLTTFMKRPVRIYPNEIGVVYRILINFDLFGDQFRRFPFRKLITKVS